MWYVNFTPLDQMSAEYLWKLEVTHMQRLRCILQITLRDCKRTTDICKRCYHLPLVKVMVTKNRLWWFGDVYCLENRRVQKQIRWFPKTVPLLSLRKALEEDLRTDGLTTCLCRDPVVDASGYGQRIYQRCCILHWQQSLMDFCNKCKCIGDVVFIAI